MHEKVPPCCRGCAAFAKHHCRLQEVCTKAKAYYRWLARFELEQYEFETRERFRRRKHIRGYK